MKLTLILIISLLLTACSTNSLNRNIASNQELGVINIVDNQGKTIESIRSSIQADHSLIDERLPPATKLIKLSSSDGSIQHDLENIYFYAFPSTPKEFHFFSCGHSVGCKSPAYNYAVIWPPKKSSFSWLNNKNDRDYLQWRSNAFIKRYIVHNVDEELEQEYKIAQKKQKKEKAVIKKMVNALFRKPKQVKIKEKNYELVVKFFKYLTHPAGLRK